MLDKSILKVICIFSFIIGLCLGLLPLIPLFTWFAFMLVMFFCAPFVIFYLKRLKTIEELEMPQCLLIGGISGFFAFLGFCLTYFPLALILYLIFKVNSFLWIKVLALNFGFLIPMVVLMALLCGLMNMFSAFLTLYVINYLTINKRG